MSIHHLSLAGNLPMPAAKKLLFMAICDDASSENGHAFPGMDKLAAWSGLKSKSRILELIAELIDEGYLARIESGHKGRRAVFQVYAGVACCSLHAPVLTGLEGSGQPDPYADVDDKGSGATDPKRAKGSGKGSDIGSGLDRTPPLSSVSPIHIGRKGTSSSAALPENWKPSESARGYALANGIDLDHEADQFRNHHTARGSQFKSWDAAFRTWLGNAKKWSRPRHQEDGSGSWFPGA